MSLNILGEPLASCCTQPITGYFRDGYCRTSFQDQGTHIVCAVVSDEFLQFSAGQGNDLMTPIPEYNFPGLKAGDRWCLCMSRWLQAYEVGVAPKIVPQASHIKLLEVIDIARLTPYFVEPDGTDAGSIHNET